jgi:hypothetical protein
MATRSATFRGALVFFVLNGLGALLELPGYLMIVSGAIGLLVIRFTDNKDENRPNS